MSDDQLTNYLRVPDPAPFTSSWARRREVKKRGSNLLFRTSELTPVPDRKVLREKVLMRFIQLEHASDCEILEYARQWGVLGLRIHGRPRNHPISGDLTNGVPLPLDPNNPNFLRDGNCAQPLSEEEVGWGVESFAQWRDYAGQIGAIIKLSKICRIERPAPIEHIKFDEFSSEMPGNPEDWVKAKRDWQLDNPNRDFRAPDPVWSGRSTLSTLISHWMTVNNIRPVFIWYKEAPSIILSATAWEFDLLPVLAVQMMLAASNSVDLGLCAGCSEPFLLRRGQSLHRNSYCLECRKLRVPQRRATQNYYHEERNSPDRKKRTALTQKQVANIRGILQRRKPGMIEQLANKYNVSKWTIYKIDEGKSWGSTK